VTWFPPDASKLDTPPRKPVRDLRDRISRISGAFRHEKYPAEQIRLQGLDD
jgi:hypothetical protein